MQDCADRPPARAVVVSTAAVGSVVAATLVGRWASLGLSGRFLLDLAAGIAACALVPPLLRRPVTGGVALVLLSALSPAATPCATLAVALVARTRPLRTALLLAAAGFSALLVQRALVPAQSIPLLWWVVLDAVTQAALVATGAFLQARASLLASLRERARRAEAEQERRVAEARAAERTAIAREMHDVLAHRLSLLATYAGALEFRPDAAPERLAEAAGLVRRGVQEALNDLRDVIGVLRSDEESPPAERLHPPPGAGDLARLVDDARRSGTPVELHGSLDALRSLPDGAGRTLYRVLQEALTNARRHAPGSPVHVTVGAQPGGSAELVVSNPLPPAGRAPLTRGSGTGLLGVDERVRLAGGHSAHGVEGGRFVLRVRVPWPVAGRSLAAATR
ncbi:sensor histidine kinase [Geodermatophilus sp. TF02-6]|uniref:sensor histidine kinase n=1 Tax=Geodermatophilus sp. TF02-6 TaxID=2250575 RepID=UPI000DEA23EB|nr:histidine kinase [Geodermatophilus sp. TF02-6]RBY75240.1 sensor histidine kinase [Geodermatophilus sp. TF02-6]